MTTDSKGNILLYQTEDGLTKIEVTLADDNVWLTADQMAKLFQRNKSTISRHIRNVFESGELKPEVVVAFFATTTQHGAVKGKTQTHTTAYYSLDMIISIGYRVNSHRGVQFRIWATQVLREYLVKGFAMNDDLLKRAGGGNYFDELLSRIRDIRSSEKVFYRKVLRYTRSASTTTRGRRPRRSSSGPYRTKCTIRLMVIRRRKLSIRERMPVRISWA